MGFFEMISICDDTGMGFAPFINLGSGNNSLEKKEIKGQFSLKSSIGNGFLNANRKVRRLFKKAKSLTQSPDFQSGLAVAGIVIGLNGLLSGATYAAEKETLGSNSWLNRYNLITNSIKSYVSFEAWKKYIRNKKVSSLAAFTAGLGLGLGTSLIYYSFPNTYFRELSVTDTLNKLSYILTEQSKNIDYLIEKINQTKSVHEVTYTLIKKYENWIVDAAKLINYAVPNLLENFTAPIPQDFPTEIYQVNLPYKRQ